MFEEQIALSVLCLSAIPSLYVSSLCSVCLLCSLSLLLFVVSVCVRVCMCVRVGVYMWVCTCGCVHVGVWCVCGVCVVWCAFRGGGRNRTRSRSTVVHSCTGCVAPCMCGLGCARYGEYGRLQSSPSLGDPHPSRIHPPAQVIQGQVLDR